jgi:hypothetical protein
VALQLRSGELPAQAFQSFYRAEVPKQSGVVDSGVVTAGDSLGIVEARNTITR